MRICPKCGNTMKNLGNISGIVMTSNPPQEDHLYVCDPCKVKKWVRVYGCLFLPPNYAAFEAYEEVK